MIRTYVGRSNQICCGLRLEFLARQVLGTWNAANIIFFKRCYLLQVIMLMKSKSLKMLYAIFTLYTITHFSILNNISRYLYVWKDVWVGHKTEALYHLGMFEMRKQFFDWKDCPENDFIPAKRSADFSNLNHLIPF